MLYLDFVIWTTNLCRVCTGHLIYLRVHCHLKPQDSGW
uniref:Uncharacterized protein n=1 Tax=Arundo donax TaxID=35708 RepID=A0A0A9C2B7_ARUDO